LRGPNPLNPPWKSLMRVARDAAAGRLLYVFQLTHLSTTSTGIGHLHKERILHRFIASENILVGESYRGYVTNFGFSHFKPTTQVYAQTNSNNLGISFFYLSSLLDVNLHFLLGSTGPVATMSPEAIAEKKYSEGSDAW